MFAHRFLADKVGSAALASVIAMVAFNIVALSYQLDYSNAPEFVSVVLHPVELA
jgi:hypothetical protein